MNTKTTLVVLLLAVLLGSAAVYKLRSSGFSSTSNNNAAALLEGTDPDATGTPLFDPAAFKPDAVDSISLTYADGSRFVFEKGTGPAGQSSSSSPGADWQQVEPISYRMTGWSIQEIANRASDLMYSTTIKEGELKGDLAPGHLGFEPPAAVIELTTDASGEDGSASSTVTIALGKTHLAGRGYVRLGDSGPVYVTGTALHDHVLGKNPREWRDKKVFPIEASDVSRLIVDSTDPENVTHFVVSRIQGDWHVIRPISVHANAGRITSLASSFANARLRGFVADDPADLASYGLDEPEMRVTAEVDRVAEDGSVRTESYELLIGHRVNLTEELWYAVRGTGGPSDVFTLPKTSIDSLRPDPAGLIGRSVLSAKPQDIEGLVIDPGGAGPRLTLGRVVDGWTVSMGDSGTSAPAVAAAVDQVLSALTQAKDSVEIDEAHVAATMPVLARIGVTAFGSDNAQQTVVIGTRLKEDASSPPVPEGQAVEYLYTLEGSGVLWVSSSSVPGFQIEELVAPLYEEAPGVPLVGEGGGNPMK
ncbi:MAG: DUF4340 domain-containing protein [Planctomycetes bacterium]|nr:DUF4340 domain-containing protein [Planctomycetota bacterium]NOG55344.1 DUF4340 domain-containing protein [Planctomycetota bacterium]